MRNAARSRCLLFIAAAIAANSCAPLPHAPTEKYVLVAANTKVAYWQTAFQGLSHAAGEMKVKAEMAGPDVYDPKAERDEFQRVAQQKPSGILVSPADPNLIGPAIDAAISQGIPVLTMDSDAANSKRLFFVGTDNYNAGTLGGQLTVTLTDGKANVVVFTMPGQTNLEDRLHGYQTVFSSHSGMKISQVIDIKGDPTIAFDATKQLLENKGATAFVCLVSIACPEVGEVVNRANMGGKVTIVAMDTVPRTLDWIQKGVISATIAQKPYTMAYYGTKLLDDLHHHPPQPLGANWNQNSLSPIPTFVDTGTFIVDKDNVAAFIKQQAQTSGGQPQ